MPNPLDPSSYSGFPGTQSGPAPQAAEPPLGQPDRGAFDFLTGIPSAAEGLGQGNPMNALLAALTLIPGGKMAGTVGKVAGEAAQPVLKAIKGGKQIEKEAAEKTVSDASSVFARHAADAAALNQRHQKAKGLWGDAADVIDLDVLDKLPKPGSNPQKWTTEQTNAVKRLNSVVNGGKGLRGENVEKALDQLVRKFKLSAVK